MKQTVNRPNKNDRLPVKKDPASFINYRLLDTKKLQLSLQRLHSHTHHTHHHHHYHLHHHYHYFHHGHHRHHHHHNNNQHHHHHRHHCRTLPPHSPLSPSSQQTSQPIPSQSPLAHCLCIHDLFTVVVVIFLFPVLFFLRLSSSILLSLLIYYPTDCSPFSVVSCTLLS